MEEGDAEAVPDVEDDSGEAGEQEEGDEDQEESLAVPVKARIICAGGEEPLTIGKALVPGGSPLHMEVPGAGTIVLTATLKPPEPAEGDIKCLCPTSKRAAGGGGGVGGPASEQLQAISTTMEQISSMQQVLSDLKSKAQAMSDQLMGGGGGGGGGGPMAPPMGGPPVPYGGMQMPMQPPMGAPGLGGVPPGGREVFSAGGVGIYVVQKDASPMGGGMPYMPGPPPMQALPAPDFGQRDWGSPMGATMSRGGDAYQPGGGGNVCGGGQMMGCGAGGCGASRVACCGGVRISCCGGGIPMGCCGAQMNPCCGGGGGGGGPPQQPGGYPRMPDVEQQLALCQGDCTVPCDSAGTPCVPRGM